MNNNTLTQYKNLQNIQKETNRLLFEFFDQYYDLFIHRIKIKSDIYLDINYKIIESYNNLKNWIEVNSFEFKYKEMNQENINKIYTDVLNKKIYNIKEYHLSKDFNPFYFNYLLVEMYILIPYIMYEYLLQNEIISSKNIEKKKYKLLVKKLSCDLYKNIKIYKEWDMLDNKVSTLSFDENDCPDGLENSYIKIHEEFQQIMNQHYIIRNKYEDSYKAITSNEFWHSKWWIILVLVIILLIIIAVAITIIKLKN